MLMAQPFRCTVNLRYKNHIPIYIYLSANIQSISTIHNIWRRKAERPGSLGALAPLKDCRTFEDSRSDARLPGASHVLQHGGENRPQDDALNQLFICGSCIESQNLRKNESIRKMFAIYSSKMGQNGTNIIYNIHTSRKCTHEQLNNNPDG